MVDEIFSLSLSLRVGEAFFAMQLHCFVCDSTSLSHLSLFFFRLDLSFHKRVSRRAIGVAQVMWCRCHFTPAKKKVSVKCEILHTYRFFSQCFLPFFESDLLRLILYTVYRKNVHQMCASVSNPSPLLCSCRADVLTGIYLCKAQRVSIGVVVKSLQFCDESRTPRNT